MSDDSKTAGGASLAPAYAGNRGPLASVLMIEDEPLIRMAQAETLRDAGYRVIEAQSAEEARAFLLRDQAIDVVVSDINLPGQTGLDFARWLRRTFPDVKIVLASGVHDYGAEAQALGHFLPKPFRLESLVELVGRLAAPAARDAQPART